MISKVFDNLALKIKDYKNEIIEMQKKLTETRAIGPENGGNGEYIKGKYVKEKITLLNPDELIEVNALDNRVPNGYRPNIVALFQGKKVERTLWIISHLDVVPAGDLELWDSDPFTAEFKNGKLYGRGVEDNQQGFIASYITVKVLREEKILPSRRIGLLIVSDEETGSEKGLKYVLKERSDLFKNTDLFLVPDSGNKYGTMIEVAEKSILWLKFEIKGMQGHAQRPDLAVNSLRAASYLITKLDKLPTIYNEKNSLFDLPNSTFEPTKKEENVSNINTIPGRDIFYMDCRILPDIPIDDILRTIHRIITKIESRFDVQVNVTTVNRVDAAPITPIDAPIIRALKDAIKTVYGRNAKSLGIGGGTVAAFLRKKGYPAAVWATINKTAHQPNEYCILNNIINDAKVFLHIALHDL